MLSVNNITFSYSRRKKPVLSDFSLRLEEGGVYGLLGSNGAGKTTLLNLISGLLTPNSGNVTINGIDSRKRLPQTLSDLFFVPEEFDLPSLTLKKFAEINGAFYPRFSFEEMLSHLSTFELEPDLKVDALSMGQKKKVALSFAMACNTRLLLLDEPTNGLDIPGKSAFRRFIASCMTDDRIFIISTHQVRDVSQILDHLLIVNDHRVLFDQKVSAVQDRLKFMDTTSPELIQKAIYAAKSIGGASVILPNTDGIDSEMNLELLFQFAHENPEKLNSLFNNK